MITEQLTKPLTETDRVKLLTALQDSFPGGFLNKSGEFIAHKHSNQYFCFQNCETEADVQGKVLEWLSRAAFKAQPYVSELSNERLHRQMLDGINAFLGTDFSEEDIEIIYQELGNAIDHNLTLRFIENGMDIEWLKRQAEEPNE